MYHLPLKDSLFVSFYVHVWRFWCRWMHQSMCVQLHECMKTECISVNCVCLCVFVCVCDMCECIICILCVCMYLCMNVWMYACMHVCMYVCLHLQVLCITCMYKLHVCMMYMHVSTMTCMHACMYVWSECTYLHVNSCIHVCKCTYNVFMHAWII